MKWVPDALKTLARLSMGDPGTSTNLIEQFHDHVWVTPLSDDDVHALLELVPVERVLFGSDYPHAEGFAEPKQFLSLLDGIPGRDQQRIIRDNARELMRQ